MIRRVGKTPLSNFILPFQPHPKNPSHHFRFIIAREGRPPSKRPAQLTSIHTNLHTSIHTKQSRHIPTSIHTNLHTSIYIKQSRHIPTSIPTSNTHKHTHKNKADTLQQRPSQTAPQKTKQQKYITLYNSKYCIRVVLRKNFLWYFL